MKNVENKVDYDKIKTLSFAKRLAFLRKNAGYSQQEFADLLEMKQSAYARYESGKYYPKKATIEKISEILKVSYDYLVNEDKLSFFFEQGINSISFTVTIPDKEFENITREQCLEALINYIDKFDDKSINMLYHCGRAIRVNNEISRIKEYYGIESVKNEAIVTKKPKDYNSDED